MKKYTELLKRRIDFKENKVPWNFGHKYDTYEFCVTNKIPVPELYGYFETPNHINLQDFPDRLVVKPAYSSTSRGVMVLERRSDSEFFDHMSKKLLNEDEIISVQQEIYDSHSKAKRKYTLAEQYVVDNATGGIPEDYKFLSFQGEIGLIIKINRNGPKLTMSYFDSEFRPVHDNRIIFNPDLADLSISETPANWRRLLDVARRASVLVPTAFSRIDLFDTHGGPVLGEITLTPGSFYYPNGHVLSESENMRLGQMWLDAEVRLWGSTL